MNLDSRKFWKNLAIIIAVALAAYWLNLPLEDDGHMEEASEKQDKVYSGSFILALSWQPAFCEKKPNKPECRSQRMGRFDASSLVLHGLWPQPKNNIYCGQRKESGRWSSLPKLELSEELRREMEVKMPGYRSYLHRHEWVKHGTCTQTTAQGYFETALSLLDRINASSLQKFFAENTGRQINLNTVRRLMDKAFGKGAGERLSFVCNRDGRRNLVSEIWISLAAKNGDLSLANKHLATAPKLKSRCTSGIIDPVGLQ